MLFGPMKSIKVLKYLYFMGVINLKMSLLNNVCLRVSRSNEKNCSFIYKNHIIKHFMGFMGIKPNFYEYHKPQNGVIKF